MDQNTRQHQLALRQQRLLEMAGARPGGFDTILIIGKVNQYYLTGTMQDALLVLRGNGDVTLYVRKSFQRARFESPLATIRPMKSYRDLLADLPADLGRVLADTQTMPVAALDRLRRHFSFTSLDSADALLLELRAVKDEQEISLIRESGRRHGIMMRETLPSLLQTGMSEADLQADLYRAMVRSGYQGVSRFAMFDTDVILGQLGFSENSLVSTSFDGPGGMRGQSAAVPMLGSRERLLRQGDLVFVDTGYGIDGYHSDKTQVYAFDHEPTKEAAAIHDICRDLLRQTAALLKPGAVPDMIYQTVTRQLPPHLAGSFMGPAGEQVRFLGHGVGLQIDEWPIIAPRRHEPLEAGMVIAIEPKCAVPGYGMVGVEETYLLTDDGAVCLTGGDQPIIPVFPAGR